MSNSVIPLSPLLDQLQQSHGATFVLYGTMGPLRDRQSVHVSS